MEGSAAEIERFAEKIESRERRSKTEPHEADSEQHQSQPEKQCSGGRAQDLAKKSAQQELRLKTPFAAPVQKRAEEGNQELQPGQHLSHQHRDLGFIEAA